MKRNEFLKIGGSLLIGSIVLPIFQGCSSLRYVNTEEENGIISVKITEIKENEDYVLIDLPDSKFPVFLGKEKNGYFALSLKCTHMGCIVDFMGNKFQCPCHGSEFSLQGQILKPPADSDLKKFHVTVEGEFIKINPKLLI